MKHSRHDFHKPVQASDGSWVHVVSDAQFNGYSVAIDMLPGREGGLQSGSLVRLSGSAPVAEKNVLWRVVAQVDAIAVLVPSDIPANVPAASVHRVENALKGRASEPKSQQSDRLAA